MGKWTGRKLWIVILLYLFSIVSMYLSRIDFSQWSSFTQYLFGFYVLSNVIGKTALRVSINDYKEIGVSRKFISFIVLLITSLSCLFIKNISGNYIADFNVLLPQIQWLLFIYMGGNVSDKFTPIVAGKIK